MLTKPQLRQCKAAGGVQAVNHAQQPVMMLLGAQLQHCACREAHNPCVFCEAWVAQVMLNQ